MLTVKKYIKKVTLLVVFVLVILSFSACSNNTTPLEVSGDVNAYTVVHKNADKTDFDFPEISDFEFTVEPENVIVKPFSKINLKCEIKNNTNCDFDTLNAEKEITYSYNGKGENIDAIAKIGKFNAGDSIKRDISVTAVKSGSIKVTGSITIVFVDENGQSVSKDYVFEKEIPVQVKAF